MTIVFVINDVVPYILMKFSLFVQALRLQFGKIINILRVMITISQGT